LNEQNAVTDQSETLMMVFAKLKPVLRKVAARTDAAIAHAATTFNQAECANYLRHAG